MIPQFLIKPIGYLCILLTWGSFCFYKGCSYTEEEYKQASIIQAKKNAKILADEVKKTEDKTRALYEDEIKRIKKRKPLPDTCVLSAEFRWMHDSATGVSKSSSTQTVTVESLADIIQENYLSSRQNAIWLEECNAICR